MKDLTGYYPEDHTFIGFASYTDYQAPPRFFMETISKFPLVNGKESFLLATYAGMVGKTLKGMKNIVEERGYRVITGHALPMPENYSPQRKRGFKVDGNPKEKDMESFQQFIRELGDLIVTRELKGHVEPKELRIGLLNSLIPMKVRTDGLKGMGRKKVDLSLCTKCGICFNNCAYKAIKLQPGPAFDETKCHACFACYNLCPVGAITSEKLDSADHQYHGPPEDLKKRMSY
jgi:ferredoxin